MLCRFQCSVAEVCALWSAFVEAGCLLFVPHVVGATSNVCFLAFVHVFPLIVGYFDLSLNENMSVF